MYCNGCGAELQAGANFCGRCGKPMSPAAQIAQPGRMERHLRVVGILWIVAGALFLLPGLLLMGVGGVAHAVVPPEEVLARELGPVVLSILGSTLTLVAVGGMLVGWGLLNRRPWARIAAVVLAVLSLFHPPFGTALGIYTLWVLLSANGEAEYARLATT